MNESTKKVREELARELIVTARRWRTRLDERLRTQGVGEARWSALYCLWRAPGGISQTTLADRAGVESPTLVRTLDLLCEAGLVERRVAPHDRRAKLVALTPAALPVVERLDAVADALRQEIMAELTPEEMTVALRVLRKLRQRLDSPEAGSASTAEVLAGPGTEDGPSPRQRQRPPAA